MISSALCKAAFVLAALAVFAELGRYFQGPVAPDERPSPPIVYRFNAEVPPSYMAEACRREGKQLLAQRRDDGEWMFDCVMADLRR